MYGRIDEALNQLFIGDTNRVIAENAFNPVSSRSHCIFTVWIESSAPGSDVVRRSKLHLVDLAGYARAAQWEPHVPFTRTMSAGCFGLWILCGEEVCVSCDPSGLRSVFTLLNSSERVSKSGVAGKLLTEAKYINLSLHHLEHVRARADCAV